MINFLMPGAAVVVLIVCLAIWPRAIRHDRRVGDRREAEGKPRSAIPPWIAMVVAVAMIIGGTLLYNSR